MRYNAAHVVTSASNIMTSLFSYVSMISIISVFIFFLFFFFTHLSFPFHFFFMFFLLCLFCSIPRLVRVFSDVLVAFLYFDICHYRQSNLAIENPEFFSQSWLGTFNEKYGN